MTDAVAETALASQIEKPERMNSGDTRSGYSVAVGAVHGNGVNYAQGILLIMLRLRRNFPANGRMQRHHATSGFWLASKQTSMKLFAVMRPPVALSTLLANPKLGCRSPRSALVIVEAGTPHLAARPLGVSAVRSKYAVTSFIVTHLFAYLAKNVNRILPNRRWKVLPNGQRY